MTFYANRHTYAIFNERANQDEAVTLLGEPTAFILWWHIDDFDANLVTRCSQCYTNTDGIAAAYGQPSTSRCDSCYGTTFEGGTRAVLYRPALWNAVDGSDSVQRKGVITTGSATIQTVSGFDMRDGDVAVRRDLSRWRLDRSSSGEFVTGYGYEGSVSKEIRSIVSATLLDEASPGHLVPIEIEALTARGWWPQ